LNAPNLVTDPYNSRRPIDADSTQVAITALLFSVARRVLYRCPLVAVNRLLSQGSDSDGDQAMSVEKSRAWQLRVPPPSAGESGAPGEKGSPIPRRR
jgi:hypothetical protein